jgi:hypothetical protein
MEISLERSFWVVLFEVNVGSGTGEGLRGGSGEGNLFLLTGGPLPLQICFGKALQRPLFIFILDMLPTSGQAVNLDLF